MIKKFISPNFFKQFSIRILIYVLVLLVLISIKRFVNIFIWERILKTTIFLNFDFGFLIIGIYLFFIILLEIYALYFSVIKKFFLKNEKKIYLAILIIFLLFNLFFQFHTGVWKDVAEHSRAGYLISQGKIPYIDFFEHHNPLYWYVISPIFFFTKGILPFYILYSISSIIFCISTFFIFKIGKIIFDNKRYAWMTTIFFVSVYPVIISYEIRPDAFSALFLIIAIYLFFKEKSNYLLLGLFIGISILFSQKAILYAGIFFITIFIINYKNINKLIKKELLFVLGAIIPTILFGTFFYLIAGSEGLKRYFFLNYLFNLKINFSYNLFGYFIKYYLPSNMLHFIFSIGGIFILIKNKVVNKKVLYLILFNFLIISYFIFKCRLSPQDFLYFTPLLAFSAIIFIKFLLTKSPFKKIICYILFIALMMPFIISLLFLTMPLKKSVDYGIIEFYLKNFEEKDSNCNLIYNPVYQYHWFLNNQEQKDLLYKHEIYSKYLSIDKMVQENFSVICTKEINQEFLIKNGYNRYLKSDIFYKK